MTRVKTVTETLEIDCAEEGRRARLLVEWSSSGEDRELVSVQCDNPKLASLEPWDCHWSCWKKVAAGRR